MSRATNELLDKAARFLVDVSLNWSAYACVLCQERMAAPSALLCDACQKMRQHARGLDDR